MEGDTGVYARDLTSRPRFPRPGRLNNLNPQLARHCTFGRSIRPLPAVPPQLSCRVSAWDAAPSVVIPETVGYFGRPIDAVPPCLAGGKSTVLVGIDPGADPFSLRSLQPCGQVSDRE